MPGRSSEGHANQNMHLISRLVISTIIWCVWLRSVYANAKGDALVPSAELDAEGCASRWNASRAVVIFIAANGNDSQECVCGETESPCRTLQHAYSVASSVVGSVTENMTFRFVDDAFTLSGSVFINIQVPSLRRVKLESVSKTEITAYDPAIVIWAGCNETNHLDSCITYGLAIENLSFTQFGSNYSAVFVVFTIPWLQIDNCEFISNNRSAVNLLDTPVTISSSKFYQNYGTANFKSSHENLPFGFPMSNTSNGGALAFIFSSAAEKSATVTKCEFQKNKAAENLLLPFVAHTLGDSQFPRIGGGVLVLFMKNCTRTSVLIRDSDFLQNGAYSGGAIAVLAEGFALNNTVILHSSKFEENTARSSSGAILFANWDFTEDHRFFIDNCTFSRNKAKYGGAIKYLVNNLQAHKHFVPLFTIFNSEIIGNFADTASAIHLILGSRERSFASVVHIANSTISQHKLRIRKNDSLGMSQFGGVVLSHRINLMFTGNNSVLDNAAGSALYASNADINVKGNLTFSRNIGISSGGAMTLADTSYLIMHPGSHLRFLENHSDGSGGALAVYTVGLPALIYVFNPFCFLQYSESSLPYSKWDTKLEFIGNSAVVKGGAVFINSLSACLWSDDPPHNSVSKALRWNDKFVYKDNFVNDMYGILTNFRNRSLYDVDIATDTFKLELGQPDNVTLAPGEAARLRLDGFDELNSQTYSVPAAQPHAFTKYGAFAEAQIELPIKYFVLDPFGEAKEISFYYEIDQENYPPNQSLFHEIWFSDTHSSFVTKATLNLNLSNCRPGFVYNGKTCVCDTNNTVVDSCRDSKVYLKRGIWATKVNGALSGFYCPDNYCQCTKVSSSKDCVFDFKNPDQQCSDGRTGTLCGKCSRPEKCISLYDGNCIKASKTHFTHAKGGFAILAISVVLVAIIVVYINPNFSTTLRGPVFYIQMLPYIFGTNQTYMGFFVRGAASLIALGGTSGLPIPGCLGINWNRLEILALTYIFAISILLVLLFTYILSRCYLLTFVRDSPFESFWILLIATYCFFSETSLIFFRCTKIGSNNVFFYDGSLICYQGLHLYMTILAAVFLLFFVILPPVGVLLMCYGVINVPLQVIDALTKGLRDEYRWWWAADLCRRFAYIAVFVFINLQGVRQVVYIVLGNIILATHCICKPYRSKWANISEAFILLSMSTIATLQLADTKGDGILIASGIVILNYAVILSIFFHKLFFFVKVRLQKRFMFSFKLMKRESTVPDPHRSLNPERIEGPVQ